MSMLGRSAINDDTVEPLAFDARPKDRVDVVAQPM